MKCTLLVASLGLLAACGAQLVSSNSYASGGGGGYSAGGYGDAGGGGGERPRMNLGISLKVPAMKINLGRMNMPKISIRAKIKQSHAPKVINVPEMHIDTQSKIPGPQGAQPAGHGQYGSGGEASYGPQQSYGYGQQSDGYGQQSSGGYEQPPAPSAYNQPQQPSYGAGQQQDYGQQLAAGAYDQQASSNYNQPASYDNMPGSYDQADLAAYNAAVAQAGAYDSASYSYAAQQQQPASSGYGQQAGSGYQAQPAAAASYGRAQPAAPTNYGRKPYGADSSHASAAQLGGYGAASPSHYGSMRAASNTRNQYGSSPSAYTSAQLPQRYSQPAQQARGYQQAAASAAKPSYGQQQVASSYAPSGQQQYAASKPASYQPSAGYSSAPAVPSYEPIGYQPLEPGHTLITATNDNYDGMTQMAVASNPAKDAPSYNNYGPPQGVSYGPQATGGASSSYGRPASSYEAPASNGYSSMPAQSSAYSPPGNNYSANQNAGSYSPSSAAAAYNTNQNTYNSNSNNNYASQPIYDDAASYGAADQGNYGARMNGPAAQQQQNGYQVEAY